MALYLKRITHPYECVKCKVTGELLDYGAYYYEDDTDGFIVSFDYYQERKRERQIEQAQYKIERALSYEEHKQRMKQAEKEFLTATIFDRPMATDGLEVNYGAMPINERKPK